MDNFATINTIMDSDNQKKVIITEENGEGGNLGEITVEKNKKGVGGFLRNLFVGEEHRGRGVGSRLLDRAIEQAGGTVSLEVEESNHVAVNLYLKKGFKVIERVSAKNGKVYLRMRRDQ